MEDWTIIILTAVCSIVASIITSFITAAIGQHNEIKNRIFDKRTALYFDFYDVIDQLNIEPMNVYSKEFLNKILEYKPSMKLLASDETIDAFQNLYEFLVNKSNSYKSYDLENDPEENSVETGHDENGDSCVINKWQEDDINYYNYKVAQYKANNLDLEKMRELTLQLYNSMRKDIGSNKK